MIEKFNLSIIADAGEFEHKKVTTTQNQACILQNQHLRVVFDDQGDLQTIVNLEKNLTVSFTHQGLYWYTSFPGYKELPEIHASGAYVFQPFFSTAVPVSARRSINCTKTDTVQKASIVFNEWASQEISLFNGSLQIELEWTVGPIPVDDDIGKEIIILYDTNIESGSTYYTDANGREVLQRIRDYRPTWHYVVDEPVSSNYYPINSRIWIRDHNRQLTILTDRSEGGGSMRDGSIEIMLHRRILHDDTFRKFPFLDKYF
ncbi:unnamed protein product [Adineta steineri]|uniref:Glycosyl hydrolase family 38 C-terminal domain-containing protein n=1 Tax=Adineta steineri TaxID=433720 RepID=A0A820HFC5_9BILA|nr:unnamed protein product [Adineta steineri]